jgi:hypothetical protein
LGLTLVLLCMCLVILLIVGVIILGFVVRRGNIKKAGQNES